MVGRATGLAVVGEVLMADKRYGVPVTVRLPEELVRRVDRLLPKMGKDRTLATFGRITRSSAVKLALLKGVEALEAEYSGK